MIDIQLSFQTSKMYSRWWTRTLTISTRTIRTRNLYIRQLIAILSSQFVDDSPRSSLRSSSLRNMFSLTCQRSISTLIAGKFPITSNSYWWSVLKLKLQCGG